MLLSRRGQSVLGARPARLQAIGRRPCSIERIQWPRTEVAPRLWSRCARLRALASTRRKSRMPCSFGQVLPLFGWPEHSRAKDEGHLTKMQMQIQGPAVPLRSPPVPQGIRLALVEVCQQPANPSIERTRPGRPGRASHVKRYALAGDAHGH